MRGKHSLILVAACFGIGLGLARTSVVQACSCAGPYQWHLELAEIEGDGDPAIDPAFWHPNAILYVLGESHVSLFSYGATEGLTLDIDLEPVP